MAAEDFLTSIFAVAQGSGPTAWLNLGINIILSTIVGGIVLLVLMEALAKKEGEGIAVKNAFLMVLIINIINLFGVVRYLMPMVPVPYAFLIIPVLIWVIFTKVFFSHIHIKHAILAGVVGFLLSIFVIPYLVSMVAGYIPAF